MKILHVNEYDCPGGAETTIAELTRGLMAAGVESHSFILANNDGSVRATAAGWWQALWEWQPDLVHLHNVGITPAVLDWAVESRLPLVWTLHDYWPICTTRMMFWGRSLCQIPCDHRCGVRREGVVDLVEQADVTLLVENPYSRDIFQQYGLRPEIVTCGLDLDAWPYGEGPRLGIFHTQADVNAWWKGGLIAQRVALRLGHRWLSPRGKTPGEIAEIMSSAAVALVPSLFPETFCRVVMEAKACGTVPVAFDVAGPRWQIEDGVTGFLAPMGDEVQLLRKTKEALAVDEEFRRRMRRDVEERWSLEKMVDDHVRVYRMRLGEK